MNIKKLMKKEISKLSTEDKQSYLSIHKNSVLAGKEESFVNKVLKAIKVITHDYSYSNNAVVDNKGIYIEVSPDLWNTSTRLFIENTGKKFGLDCRLQAKFKNSVPDHKNPPDVFFPFTFNVFSGKIANALEDAGYKVKLI